MKNGLLGLPFFSLFFFFSFTSFVIKLLNEIMRKREMESK